MSSTEYPNHDAKNPSSEVQKTSDTLIIWCLVFVNSDLSIDKANVVSPSWPISYLAPIQEIMKDISVINTVISTYFEENTDVDITPVKRLMPALIKAGVFQKDKKNGLPIRMILKSLDQKNELAQIPSVYVVRKEGHSFWYFKREGHSPESLEIDKTPPKDRSKRELNKLVMSEEAYVLDLCDQALKLVGLRHHTFEFLLGDLHDNGKARKAIPCDIYYPARKLVIEFRGFPHNPISKEQSDQREIYAKRKRTVLPEHKIQLLEIPHELFELNEQKSIMRNHGEDLERIKALLAPLDLESEVIAE